jgi:tetratricopeptide (TPR) repeat protein
MDYRQARAILLSSLIFFLGLAAHGQVPAASSQPSCADTPFAEAEKLRLQQRPETLAKAIDLYRQALNCRPDSLAGPRKAEILLRMGEAQLSMENYEEALDALRSSAAIFAEIDSRNNTVRAEEAEALLKEALALRGLGRIDEAIAAYKGALGLFQLIRDRPGESRILGDLCHVDFLMGKYESALEQCNRARALILGSAPTQESDNLKAFLLDLYGRILFQMNDWVPAQQDFDEALVLAKKRDYQRFIALTLNDLGLLSLKQGRPALARDRHQDALQRIRKYQPADKEAIAETLYYLGNAQEALREDEIAASNYQEALSLQRLSGDAIGEAQTLVSLANLEQKLGRPTDALSSLAGAVELYRRVSDRAGQSEAMFQMAQVYERLGRESDALNEAKEAIALGETIRKDTPRSLRIAAFSSLQEMYAFEIDLYLKKEPVSAEGRDQAFAVLEKARARALLDRLEERMNDNDLPCGAEITARWKRVRDDLEEENSKFRGQLASRAKDAVLKATRIVIEGLESQRDKIQVQCQSEQPRLAVLVDPAMSFAEIRDEILDGDDIAFVQFYLAKTYSYAWVVTQGSASGGVRLPPAGYLEDLVKRTLEFRSREWTTSQRSALHALREALTPVFRLARAKRWIVVPDGALHYLPFGFFAMEGPWPEQVVKIPSAAAIRAVRSEDRDRQAARKVAIFADPVFHLRDSRVTRAGGPQPHSGSEALLPASGARQSGPSFSRLLYSREEGQAIARLLPRDRVSLFLDFSAKLGAASGEALGGFRVIHLATHSLVNDRHPDLSQIVFSLVTPEGRPQPGRLFQKDIYRLRLNSDLVVLSSCSSAAGSTDRGEGILSLARAFLFAGSKSVLASRWEVDDAATSELLRRFYGHLFKDRLSVVEALAGAQAELRNYRTRKFRNPFYWAGFELYGDWHDSALYEMFQPNSALHSEKKKRSQ